MSGTESDVTLNDSDLSRMKKAIHPSWLNRFSSKAVTLWYVYRFVYGIADLETTMPALIFPSC